MQVDSGSTVEAKPPKNIKREAVSDESGASDTEEKPNIDDFKAPIPKKRKFEKCKEEEAIEQITIASDAEEDVDDEEPARRDIDVVLQALDACIECNDYAGAQFMAKTFQITYCPLLKSDVDDKLNALVPLFKMATDAKIPDISVDLLNSAFTLLKSSNVDIYQQCLMRLSKRPHIFKNSQFDTVILSLYELALKKGYWRVEDLPRHIESMLCRSLQAADCHVRIAGIRFKLQRCFHDPLELSTIENFLSSMLQDRDRRVRLTAVEGLIAVMGKNALKIETYQLIKPLIRDSDRQVRVATLQLLQLFAKFLGSLTVKDAKHRSILLNDEAFSLVCEGINDMEVPVRAEAARLLGEFEDVSDSFLDQTVDKKMMVSKMSTSGVATVSRITESMFSITKGKKERKNWKFKNYAQKDRGHSSTSNGSAAWSTGKKLHEAAPDQQNADKDDDSIMAQGACGAFVTALEDEFQAVRRAGVYALGKLAANRPTFASTALDHLADMFNDEIAAVRVDAIKALTPLVVHGQLYVEQLHVILTCLDDEMVETRNALRVLLTKADFADLKCLRVTVNALLVCLKRYPRDIQHIFKTFSALGARHAILVQALVPELLNLSPIFEPIEHHPSNPEYLSKAFFILSAAGAHSDVLDVLPTYLRRHYPYIRTLAPDLVPVIEEIDHGAHAASLERLDTVKTAWTEGKGHVLNSIFTQVASTQREFDVTVRNKLRKLLINDTTAISELNQELTGGAHLIKAFAEIMTGMDNSVQQMVFGSNPVAALQMVEVELNESTAIDDLFNGIPAKLKPVLFECSARYLIIKSVMQIAVEPSRAQKHLLLLRPLLKKLVYRIYRQKFTVGENLKTIIKGANKIAVQCSKESLLKAARISQLIFENPLTVPTEVDALDAVKIKWAKILEPKAETTAELPLRFVAGLPTCIRLNAILYNFEASDIKRLRIKVVYPDRVVYQHRPFPDDFVKDETGTFTLTTNVVLGSKEPWRFAAEVMLHVVLAPSPPRQRRIRSIAAACRTAQPRKRLFPTQDIKLFSDDARSSAASVAVTLHPMFKRC